MVPTGAFLERQVQAGIYAEIDSAKLSNYGNLDAVLKEKVARVQGVEPQPSDPETDVLPLDNTRTLSPILFGLPPGFNLN